MTSKSSRSVLSMNDYKAVHWKETLRDDLEVIVLSLYTDDELILSFRAGY